MHCQRIKMADWIDRFVAAVKSRMAPNEIFVIFFILFTGEDDGETSSIVLFVETHYVFRSQSAKINQGNNVPGIFTGHTFR